VCPGGRRCRCLTVQWDHELGKKVKIRKIPSRKFIHSKLNQNHGQILETIGKKVFEKKYILTDSWRRLFLQLRISFIFAWYIYEILFLTILGLFLLKNSGQELDVHIQNSPNILSSFSLWTKLFCDFFNYLRIILI